LPWEAVGALAEIASAVGVVLTLAYVAVQIRHNTRALRSTVHDAASSQMREVHNVIIADPVLHRIWTEGLEEPQKLDPLERARLFHVFFLILGAYETFYFQFRVGTLDAGRWEANRVQLQNYMSGPAFREYWSKRGDFFSSEFRSLVASLDLSGGVRLAQLAGLVENANDR